MMPNSMNFLLTSLTTLRFYLWNYLYSEASDMLFSVFGPLWLAPVELLCHIVWALFDILQ